MGRTLEVNGHRVSIFKVGSLLLATEEACAHMGGAMSLGDIEVRPAVASVRCGLFRLAMADPNPAVVHQVAGSAVDPVAVVESQYRPFPRRRGSKSLPSERIAGSSRIGTGFEGVAPTFLSGDSCAHTTGSCTDNLVTHLLKRERDISR